MLGHFIRDIKVSFEDKVHCIVKPVTRGHLSRCLNCIFCELKCTSTLKCTCDEGTPVMRGHLMMCLLVTGSTVIPWWEGNVSEYDSGGLG